MKKTRNRFTKYYKQYNEKGYRDENTKRKKHLNPDNIYNEVWLYEEHLCSETSVL